MARAVKPLTKFLEPAPTGVGDGFSRGAASTNGATMKSLLQHPGWDLLQAMIEREQRHEQLILMKSPPGADPKSHERIIGQWGGMERVAAIAEGVVAYGEKASAEIESGRRPEQEAS